MYELLDTLTGPIMGLRIQQDITGGETRQLVQLIQERYEQFGPVRLLVIFQADFGLMGAEDLYDNMRFAKLTGENIAKMAVIGNRDWENTWVGLFGLFGGIKANYYDHSRLDAALEWLKE